MNRASRAGLLILTMLAACSMAEVIHRDEYSGVIELQGDRDGAMQKAKNEMAGHCGADNYTVVSEGYEPSGRDMYTQQTYNNGYSSSSTSTASSGRVWRVHYQCNNAPAGYQPPYQGQPQYPGQPGGPPQQPPYQGQPQYPQQPQYPDPQQQPQNPDPQQQPQYPPPQQYPQR